MEPREFLSSGVMRGSCWVLKSRTPKFVEDGHEEFIREEERSEGIGADVCF
jgi:hypothetical protein